MDPLLSMRQALPAFKFEIEKHFTTLVLVGIISSHVTYASSLIQVHHLRQHQRAGRKVN